MAVPHAALRGRLVVCLAVLLALHAATPAAAAVGAEATLTTAAADSFGLGALAAHTGTAAGGTFQVLRVYVNPNGTDTAGCGANGGQPCASLGFAVPEALTACTQARPVLLVLAAAEDTE